MFNLNYSAKIKEAEDHVKQGEKYLKTSLTKWKPDLDSAIEEYDKACTCYRVAEKYELCRDLSIKLAELQIQKGSTFFAAKSYEQVAQMTQQLQDLAAAAKYYDKAGQLYAEGGQRDSAAILYERCAPQFQQFDRAISIDFYLKGARLAEQEDKAYQAADLYEKAAMQVLRTGNFPKTTELLETVTTILTSMERYDRLNRVILYRILLKLFNEDSVAGRNIFDQACQEYPSFDQWEEHDHIALLLDAFDQDDKDLISRRCQVNHCFFSYLLIKLLFFRNHISWQSNQNLFVYLNVGFVQKQIKKKKKQQQILHLHQLLELNLCN
jgi:tetratricopeptide (TPR) repeat protein